MERLIEYLLNNVLAIIAIIVSFLAYIHSKKSDKSNLKREIALKKAELKTISSIHQYADSTTMNNNMVRRSVLEQEIKELEKLL